ncbi:MAG: DUF2330 domain-containing protein [Actinomycetota bacterium]|nr:DUF2330 domain-containing protein [Actinomycetota bacterium]
MRRASWIGIVAVALVVVLTVPAWACGGLVNPNGTVSLVRTTTMVGYVDGVEHYVTSFEFAGGGAEFGSIVPLPGVPSKVERAGDWTLQRLVQEVQPQVTLESADAAGAAISGSRAEVLLETRIDALDITILKGGGDEVGRWAKENGFVLTPDAPEVLDFYAARSPVFMAARFDPAAAAGANQEVGDGTPVHLTIPTPNPWVPLRILGLGLGPDASVEADVFLLTDGIPEMLPRPAQPGDRDGLLLERDEEAPRSLLADLRSDKGMSWIPTSDMWFTYLRIDTTAGQLDHDLAIDVTGRSAPSPVAAGLEPPVRLPDLDGDGSLMPWVIALMVGAGALAVSKYVWDRA